MALAHSDFLCSSMKPPKPGIHCLFLSAILSSRLPGEWLIKLSLQYSRAFLVVFPNSSTFFSQASYKGGSILWSGLSQQGPIFWYKFSGFANLFIAVTKKIPHPSNLGKDFFSLAVLGAARAVWEGAVAEKGGFRSRGIAVRQERVKGVVFSFPFAFIRLRIPIHGMVPPTQ